MADGMELSVRVPVVEVLRYMGYPRTRTPSSGVQRRIDELWGVAEGLVSARGAWRRADRQDAIAVGVPRPTDHLAFAVCTIGLGVELASEERGRADDAIGALFLDAFGSAAAEAAAESLHARICAEVQRSGWDAAQRISPGYGDWHVARQRDLLGRLPCARLGLTLTAGAMMVPRKSVSFAVLFGPVGEKRPRHRCAACELVTCRYRLEAPDEEPSAQEPEQT